jgi:hypothetical protein
MPPRALWPLLALAFLTSVHIACEPPEPRSAREPPTGYANMRPDEAAAAQAELANVIEVPMCGPDAFSRSSIRDAGANDADAPDGGPSTPVSNASSVIASLRQTFRRCYQRGLDGNPRMQGGVLVYVKVAPDGNVESTTACKTDNISNAVAQCLRTALAEAKFEPPGGTGSTLTVPITFKKQ